MPKKGTSAKPIATPPAPRAGGGGKPSSLLDTRVVYCAPLNLEQLQKLPDAWLRRATSSRVDLIYIDPGPVSAAERPFNSKRNYEVFWGEGQLEDSRPL